MEAHSNCNARCSYCSEMFYGGLNPNYDIENMLDKFRKEKAFEENVSITWGGGEPVLLKNFDINPDLYDLRFNQIIIAKL